ncbi:unnamed protein product [Scytosiphon promiscuus]
MTSYTLSCESDFEVRGLQEGEDYCAPVRILCTFCTASVISAWLSWTRIRRLSIFFAHWVSGLILALCLVLEDMMVTVCWTTNGFKNTIRFLKFLEVAASNMMAITNLAICVNLALIITSHRSVTRVKSITSPALFLFLILISAGIAGSTVPFCDEVVLLGTMFWCTNDDQGENTYMLASVFFLEFLVGILMFTIVAWQLLFRRQEIRECWTIHVRIRYYFGLTLLGTLANLALGICGTIYIANGAKYASLLSWSWVLRYVYSALDTVVLYGVLGEQRMVHYADESQLSESMSSDLVKT